MRVLRVVAILFSLYALYLGLKNSDLRDALPYIFPGTFWFAYYYHFVREFMGRNPSFEERVHYLIFMFIGISTLFIVSAYSTSGKQFIAGFILWLFVLFLLMRWEVSIESMITKLGQISSLIIPIAFGVVGAILSSLLIMLYENLGLALSYFLTFSAIEGTVYEWEKQSKYQLL